MTASNGVKSHRRGGQTTSALQLIMWSSKTGRKTSSVASAVWHEQKWPNYGPGPKSAINSDSFWIRWLFSVCVRVFYAPNATILLIYIPTKIKMSFIWKEDFFAKIGIFCKSIAGPLSEANTQPYSFGGRVKLIICQIRHELSFIIHEISTSWKKNVRWQTL